jgi:phage-related protein
MAGAKRSKTTTGSVAGESRPIRRRWRDYKTPSGRSPVEEFIEDLSDADAAAVLVGMEEGGIWEVRVDGDRVIYRILFAEEGSRGQVLLALEGFNKKTQKTPPAIVKLAKTRLADWRRRGDQKRKMQSGRALHR